MEKLNYKNIIFNILFALACLISVSFFWKNTTLVIIILATISGIGLSKWKNRETVILFILSGIFGTIAEAIIVYFGVWTYTSPNFMGLPYWLPLLWGDAAVFIYQQGLEIKNLRL